MLVVWQTPPAILTFFHERKFCPGREKGLVQEFNHYTGFNQRIDNLSRAVIPYI